MLRDPKMLLEPLILFQASLDERVNDFHEKSYDEQRKRPTVTKQQQVVTLSTKKGVGRSGANSQYLLVPGGRSRTDMPPRGAGDFEFEFAEKNKHF